VDGIAQALAGLRSASCVASSGSHAKMRHTLGRTGLHDYFAGRIFSATEVSRGKPAPDLFLHAARTIGVEPAACAVVEDTPSGVQAAVAAGMRAIGYIADSDERALCEAGAERLDSLDELPRLPD
jgi:HAD superfamily hydrolase (TIGR01509 family)